MTRTQLHSQILVWVKWTERETYCTKPCSLKWKFPHYRVLLLVSWQLSVKVKALLLPPRMNSLFRETHLGVKHPSYGLWSILSVKTADSEINRRWERPNTWKGMEEYLIREPKKDSSRCRKKSYMRFLLHKHTDVNILLRPTLYFHVGFKVNLGWAGAWEQRLFPDDSEEQVTWIPTAICRL